MKLMPSVSVYVTPGQVMLGHGGGGKPVNPVEASRKRVIGWTGWRKMMPEGALQKFLDRLGIQKMFVPYGVALQEFNTAFNKESFGSIIELLPQDRELTREEIESVLQKELAETGFDAHIFIAFKEAYFYPSELHQRGGAAAPTGGSRRGGRS